MTLNVTLWIVQALLAAVFLFAGGTKLVLPFEALQGPIAFPEAFIRFIGAAEVTGAIGLILPWALKIRPGLTPLAASCLAIIMVGATVVTILGGPVGAAPIPAVIGLLLVWVAYGRRKMTRTTRVIGVA